MIRGIHHVSITVQDMDRMLAFYRDVLGFPEIMRSSWADSDDMDRLVDLKGSQANVVLLNAGNMVLELFDYRAPSGIHDPRRPVNNPGYTHICLDVEDIETEYRRLESAGMTFNRSIMDVEELGLRAVYGRDPEGNVIEVQEIFDDANDLALHPQLRTV